MSEAPNGLCADCGHPRDDHQSVRLVRKNVTLGGMVDAAATVEVFACLHRNGNYLCGCGIPDYESHSNPPTGP